MKLISSRMRVELRRARRPAVMLVLGITAAIAAIGLLIARENVHLPWESQYTAQIAVSNATGVEPGLDEVRWAGIVVGRITGEKVENGQPVLTAQFNASDLHGARLYRDAQIQLRPQTPLSDMYLDVVNRGHASAGVLGPNEVLQASQTQTPVNVADVLDTFSEPIRLRLQELLDELATGLSPAGGAELRTAFGEIASLLVAQKQLSHTLATRSVLVKALIHDSGTLFNALNQRNTELTGLIQNGSGTLGALGSQSAALSRIIAALPGTLDQIHSSFGQLQTTLGVVRPALVNLLPTARELPSGLHALKSFSESATPALTALNPAVSALEPLVRNLPGSARALNGALTSLEPQIPRYGAVTAAIVPCELPVQKFFAWTLSVLKFDNAGNRTASPRGTTVVGPFASGAKDPTLAPAIGCADGRPAPTTPDHAPTP
ncbi:MAG TPA: MlaD family protein [Solirubrobacteraceae bacterium]|nr:MlaD family protein [Solirubrobacteraceae bacterium]